MKRPVIIKIMLGADEYECPHCGMGEDECECEGYNEEEEDEEED